MVYHLFPSKEIGYHHISFPSHDRGQTLVLVLHDDGSGALRGHRITIRRAKGHGICKVHRSKSERAIDILLDNPPCGHPTDHTRRCKGHGHRLVLTVIIERDLTGHIRRRRDEEIDGVSSRDCNVGKAHFIGKTRIIEIPVVISYKQKNG